MGELDGLVVYRHMPRFGIIEYLGKDFGPIGKNTSVSGWGLTREHSEAVNRFYADHNQAPLKLIGDYLRFHVHNSF